MGLKLLADREPAVGDRRFRRTLVGLKHTSGDATDLFSYLFQTNPCGIEAPITPPTQNDIYTFQTNPCGIEASNTVPTSSGTRRGFQTNPCGIEAIPPGRERRRRRTFQTNPCGIEAASARRRRDRRDRFRRTLVGLKQSDAQRDPRQGGVSDEPLWD